MTRVVPQAALALALAGAGCRSEPVLPPPDPRLVDALVEAHLADARAEADSSDGDSARRAALRVHGLTDEEVAHRIARAARRPAEAGAMWSAVAARLDAERLGLPAEPADTAASPGEVEAP